MSSTTLVQPKVGLNAFICPYCKAYAEQYWADIQASNKFKGNPYYDHKFGETLSNYYVSKCRQCKKYAIWLDDKIILPNTATVPCPNDDLPDDMPIYEVADIIEWFGMRSLPEEKRVK